MFCIRDVRMEGEKIVMTMETTDVQDLLYVRFLRKAAEFADSFSYRVSAYGKAARREREMAERAPLDRADRSKLLAVFRTIPGARADRLRTFRGILAAQGRPATATTVVSLLTLARAEEREEQAGQIRAAIAAGRSTRDISKAIGIPKSTVDRLRKDAPESPRIDERPARPLPSPGRTERRLTPMAAPIRQEAMA